MAEAPLLKSQLEIDYQMARLRLEELTNELEEVRRNRVNQPVAPPSPDRRVTELENSLVAAERRSEELLQEARQVRQERDSLRERLQVAERVRSAEDHHDAETRAEINRLTQKIQEQDNKLAQFKLNHEKTVQEARNLQQRAVSLEAQLAECRKQNHQNLGANSADQVTNLIEQVEALKRERDAAIAHAKQSFQKYRDLRNQFSG